MAQLTTDTTTTKTANRIVTLNEQSKKKFPTNKIETRKYNLITFVPLFLFDQFSKPANVYFLTISLLQQIPGLSPTGRWGTLTPLLLSLVASACKEIFEDFARAKEDESINLRKVLVLDRDGDIDSILLESLHVGQVIKILRDELVPADLVLLRSSELDGLCYLETAAIDGETNLKLRQAHSKTNEIENHFKLNSSIVCDPPNNQIYTFNGTLNLNSLSLPLDHNQFLPRGSILVNTEWIIGVIVYTGKDTKIMQNVKEAPRRKVTKMDKLNDLQNAQIVGILFVLVAILFCGHFYYNTYVIPKFTYMKVNDSSKGSLWSNFASFVTFLLLLNNLVPISLSVTLEIVRSLLAHLINNDLDMYDDELQIPSKAQSSNVLDELGRIEFIMTDKTGTLTCNQMALKSLLIKDSTFLDCLDDQSHLKTCLSSESSKAHDLKRFIEFMALCHTVMIDKRTGALQASSPDELALLNAAKHLGCTFTSRTSDQIKLKSFSQQEISFNLKAVLEFTSDRKRMTIVLQNNQTGKYFVITKGADSVILPLCTNYIDQAETSAELFAIEGLRTLCFATRDLSDVEFSSWYTTWTAANTTIGAERNMKIASAASEIESNLQFIAISGIEDKLQADVPKSIATLQDANIKIWILTGDRSETATNTAYLSGLLKSHHALIKIFTENDLNNALLQLKHANSYVIIISGEMFAKILSNQEIKPAFGPISANARSLIACRLSPLQKSEITRYVQVHLNKTTLAIGDGGNDVGMIQAADVGVGINGLEGTQAARSADFSIPKFRFIVKLLLVHGAWSFHRISRVILYTMYKNFAIVLCQFYFASMNTFSAQSAFGSFLLLLYNSLFSVAPPVIIGITDQYVTAPELIKHPQLYRFGQRGKFYNQKAFWECIVNASVQSFILCFCFHFLIKADPIFTSGQPLNLVLSGDLFYFIILLTISIKVLLFTNYFTRLMSAALLAALSACFLILFTKSTTVIFKSALFPSAVVLIPVISLLRDFLWKFYRRQFKPRAYHIVQEMRAVEIKRETLSGKKMKLSKTSSFESETAPLKKK